jgi:hypothetical protein
VDLHCFEVLLFLSGDPEGDEQGDSQGDDDGRDEDDLQDGVALANRRDLAVGNALGAGEAAAVASIAAESVAGEGRGHSMIKNYRGCYLQFPMAKAKLYKKQTDYS